MLSGLWRGAAADPCRTILMAARQCSRVVCGRGSVQAPRGASECGGEFVRSAVPKLQYCGAVVHVQSIKNLTVAVLYTCRCLLQIMSVLQYCILVTFTHVNFGFHDMRLLALHSSMSTSVLILPSTCQFGQYCDKTVFECFQATSCLISDLFGTMARKSLSM